MRRACLIVLAIASGGVARATEVTYVAAGAPREASYLPAPLPERAFGAFAATIVDGRRAPAAPSALVPAIDPARARAAAVILRCPFQVGEELPRLRLLRLRARFQDSLVATVNDVEVARRNLDAAAAPDALAQRTRGAEWESLFVPVTPGLLHPGENVLTVEVRPSAARLAPIVDVELTASDAAHVVRGPIVQRVTGESATIVFETDLPTTGEVRLPGRVLADPNGAATRHVIDLDGLSPGTEIEYQIAAGEEVSGTYRFHTAPGPGEPVRLVVYGDVRGGHDVHAEIAQAVEAEAADFVITTGDMVNRATDEADWQKFFAITGGLLARTPLYPALGNHDMGLIAGRERRFEDIFALPGRPADCPSGASWYSFDFGSVHVVMLDSNHYADERQLAWLEDDLARTRARAIIAAAHQGPYSRGPHGGEPLAAERYVPVLARHHVAVLFSGHDHLYQRGEMGGLTYVVAGGGGAPIYQPRCGAPGKPACKTEDGARAVIAAHHYVVVDVFRDDVRMCPKRPDGTPLEACLRIPLAPAAPR